MFSARDLETHGVAVHVNGTAGGGEIPLDFSCGDAERRIGRDHAWHRKPGLPQRIWEVAPGATSLRVAMRDISTHRIGAMEVDLPLAPEPQAPPARP